jgi:hypothetical protein
LKAGKLHGLFQAVPREELRPQLIEAGDGFQVLVEGQQVEARVDAAGKDGSAVDDVWIELLPALVLDEREIAPDSP